MWLARQNETVPSKIRNPISSTPPFLKPTRPHHQEAAAKAPAPVVEVAMVLEVRKDAMAVQHTTIVSTSPLNEGLLPSNPNGVASQRQKFFLRLRR
jgi:hypothetical protein